nr:hypothetical protein [Candidatus Freyarchaeota archaeon]
MRGVKGERVPLVNGVGMFLDLDNFKEVMRKMGWSEFRPNPITGTLTQLVQRLAAKYNATVLW